MSIDVLAVASQGFINSRIDHGHGHTDELTLDIASQGLLEFPFILIGTSISTSASSTHTFSSLTSSGSTSLSTTGSTSQSSSGSTSGSTSKSSSKSTSGSTSKSSSKSTSGSTSKSSSKSTSGSTSLSSTMTTFILTSSLSSSVSSSLSTVVTVVPSLPISFEKLGFSEELQAYISAYSDLGLNHDPDAGSVNFTLGSMLNVSNIGGVFTSQVEVAMFEEGLTRITHGRIEEEQRTIRFLFKGDTGQDAINNCLVFLDWLWNRSRSFDLPSYRTWVPRFSDKMPTVIAVDPQGIAIADTVVTFFAYAKE